MDSLNSYSRDNLLIYLRIYPINNKSEYTDKNITFLIKGDNKSWIKTISLDLIENNVNVKNFELKQNYPNPFNPKTIINYQIPESGQVIVQLFDILGKEIKEIINEFKEVGSYSFEFDATAYRVGHTFINLS